jgi:hypothetical protein
MGGRGRLSVCVAYIDKLAFWTLELELEFRAYDNTSEGSPYLEYTRALAWV